jgi:hypothetical protein
LVPFGYEVNSVTGSNAFQVSNPSFCIGGGSSSSHATGVQDLKVCDTCCDQIFYQIIPLLQKTG